MLVTHEVGVQLPVGPPSKTCDRHRLTYTGQKCKRCNVETLQIQRDIRKERAVAYLGGSCSRCGYNKCIKALEFHHVDPSTKLFNIADKLRFAWDRLRAELDKCILVCANCHREIE